MGILHSSTLEGKHHGVGFIVSPFLRPFMSDFVAHTHRICEVTLQIIPHPITVFCVYAPSQVENSEKDLARKLDFWDTLDTLISSHSNADLAWRKKWTGTPQALAPMLETNGRPCRTQTGTRLCISRSSSTPTPSSMRLLRPSYLLVNL